MTKWLISLGVFLLASFPAQAFQSLKSIRTIYTGSNVTTTTALSLVASMPVQVSAVTIFDSSGDTMALQITSGGVITTLLIPPGGGGFPLNISVGDAVSIIGVQRNARRRC